MLKIIKWLMNAGGSEYKKEEITITKKYLKGPISFCYFFIKRGAFVFVIWVSFQIVGMVAELTIWPASVAYLVEKISVAKSSNLDIWKSCLGALKIYIIMFISTYIAWRVASFAMAIFIPKMEYEIRSSLFNRLITRTYDFFLSNNPSEITSRITNIASSYTDLISDMIKMIIPHLFAFAILAGSIAIIDLKLGFIIMTASIIDFIVLIRFIPKTVIISELNSLSYNNLLSKASDSIFNISPTKIFTGRSNEVGILSIFASRGAKNKKKVIMYAERMKWIITINHGILIGILSAILTIKLFINNKISIGQVTYIFMCTANMLYAFWMFAEQLTPVLISFGYCKDTSMFLFKNEKTEKINGADISVKNGKIEFKELTFSYEGKSSIFRKKNVVIKSREKVALIGSSGSGKTTFVNLIVGYFKATGGEILIDGQDIYDFSIDSVRSNISIIPQDSMLFNRSILDNIRYARPDASFQEVVSAAKKAHAHDFIMDMEHGYHTRVADRGLRLSGGQRQRISIARAFLKEAPILILDEATSALDRKTEVDIQKSLDLLMKDKTTIIIAHRLETITKVDRIIVFSRGEIVEEGSHEALIAKDGYYARMLKTGMNE